MQWWNLLEDLVVLVKIVYNLLTKRLLNLIVEVACQTSYVRLFSPSNKFMDYI